MTKTNVNRFSSENNIVVFLGSSTSLQSEFWFLVIFFELQWVKYLEDWNNLPNQIITGLQIYKKTENDIWHHVSSIFFFYINRHFFMFIHWWKVYGSITVGSGVEANWIYGGFLAKIGKLQRQILWMLNNFDGLEWVNNFKFGRWVASKIWV